MQETENINAPTFYLQAFGCPSSQYEGEAVRSLLLKEGFSEATRTPAQVYVINTCVVTESAVRKARKAVRKAKKNNPRSLVVLMGCYPQVYEEQACKDLPEVDIFLGNEGRGRLPSILQQRLKGGEDTFPWSLVSSTVPQEPLEELATDIECRRARPVLKVQEGCNRRCSYCIVTSARGAPRSLSPATALKQVENFLQKGHREIIIAGTNLGLYGKDLKNWNLIKLLRCLDELPYDFRLRLSYLEPNSVTEEFLKAVYSSSKICPYLYLPLQSGSDYVLRKMGRSYSVKDLEKIISRTRELLPQTSIYSDIIVGFPGEREEDYRLTMDRVRRWKLSGLHIFSYSPRPLTPAYSLQDKVRPDIIKRRYQEMKTVHQDLALNFHREMSAQTLRVLVERIREGWGEGFSDNYIWVKFPLGKNSQGPSAGPGSGENQAEELTGSFVLIRPLYAYTWGIEGEIPD